MLSGSGRSARRAGRCSRLGTLGVVLLPLLLTAPALADEPPAPVVCSAPGWPQPGRCYPPETVRQIDTWRGERAGLVRLRIAHLARIADLEHERDAWRAAALRWRGEALALRSERPWLPGWAWWLGGVVSGVVGSVVLALAL